MPLRLVSYLLAVDGEASVDQLAARYQNLPSLQAVLEGLAGQGFLEVAGAADNVVGIGQMRVANGANIPQGYPSAPPPQQTYAPPPQQQYQPAANYFPELESYKANMARDVTALLGSDSAPVVAKIQACKSKDDLFGTMMGIKKIVTIYTNRDTAEKFGARYTALSN